MPMIGARFYTQLDSAFLWGDMVEGELEKVSLTKLNTLYYTSSIIWLHSKVLSLISLKNLNYAFI